MSQRPFHGSLCPNGTWHKRLANRTRRCYLSVKWKQGNCAASAAWWFRSFKPNILEISPFLSISWEENTWSILKPWIKSNKTDPNSEKATMCRGCTSHSRRFSAPFGPSGRCHNVMLLTISLETWWLTCGFLVGGWATNPSEKWWSEFVGWGGHIPFPINMESHHPAMFQTTKQYITGSHHFRSRV